MGFVKTADEESIQAIYARPHFTLLVHIASGGNIQAAQRGRGELVFRESPHDPVADVPVTQVIQAIYTEGVSYTSGKVLCEVDPDAFLPYAFGKMNSMYVIVEETLMHAQAARKTDEGCGRWREGPS